MQNEDLEYSHLRIELSSNCNLDCQYCRSIGGFEYHNDFGEISKEMIFQLIDEAESLGFKVIVLTGGGEPFCREDIFEIIEYGNLSKIVITNGTLFDEETVFHLSKLKLLSYVKISFDGFRAQSELRGASSVDKIKKAIELLELYEIPFAINTVITKNNLSEIDELYDYIVGTKAFSWGIYPLIPLGRAEKNNLVCPHAEDIAKTVAPVIAKYINDNRPFSFEIRNLFTSELLDRNWDNNILLSKKTDHPCAYQLSAVTVRLNGDVSQCSYLRVTFGNIYRNKLGEIIFGELRTKFLDKKIMDCEICMNCKYISFCSGGCVGLKQIMNIDEFRPDIIACDFAKAYEKHIVPIFPLEIQKRIHSEFNCAI